MESEKQMTLDCDSEATIGKKRANDQNRYQLLSAILLRATTLKITNHSTSCTSNYIRTSSSKCVNGWFRIH